MTIRFITFMFTIMLLVTNCSSEPPIQDVSYEVYTWMKKERSDRIKSEHRENGYVYFTEETIMCSEEFNWFGTNTMDMKAITQRYRVKLPSSINEMVLPKLIIIKERRCF